MKTTLYSTAFFLIFFVNRTSAQAPTLSLTPVIQNLNQPMQLVNAGDGTGRIFIVEKGGVIKAYSKSFAFLDTF